MVRLAVFDVNETLFSLDPVAARMVDVGLEGQLELWFTRVLRDGIAAAAAGRYAPFAELADHHLRLLLRRHAPDDPQRHAPDDPQRHAPDDPRRHAPDDPRRHVPDDAVAHVLAGFREVEPHPDVGPGLAALADAGITAVALTNGSADLTRAFLARAGLASRFAAVHDVAEVARWKPAAAPYRAVLATHATDAADAAMISVHPWDVLGAQAAGMVGAWLDRDRTAYPAAFGAPDVAAADLPALVEGLSA
jgi:2-haloacid dehalogenase